MSVFQRVRMPSLDGATGWVKSDPLGPAELRGHVVLLTSGPSRASTGCTRSRRRARGRRRTATTGCSSLESTRRSSRSSTTSTACGRRWRWRDIDYRVAQENDYAVWSAFANHHWPALYFVDADGVIRDKHFGEGRYSNRSASSSVCSAWSASSCPSKGSAW